MILLDTCSILWLADGGSRLSPPARKVLQGADAEVYVSAISAFELGTKVAKRKLVLRQPVSEWFPALCEAFALRELPVTAAIAAAATELPELHGDPADRILVATAREFGLAIMTPDEKIALYPGVKTIW